MYILWSATLNGWLSRSGTIYSDVTQAKVCTREEAIDLCKITRGLASRNLIPVDLELYREATRDVR